MLVEAVGSFDLYADGSKAPRGFGGGILDIISMGRVGMPEVMVELLCWMLCDRSSYITGSA
jgi:hypothetical protein